MRVAIFGAGKAGRFLLRELKPPRGGGEIHR